MMNCNGPEEGRLSILKTGNIALILLGVSRVVGASFLFGYYLIHLFRFVSEYFIVVPCLFGSAGILCVIHGCVAIFYYFPKRKYTLYAVILIVVSAVEIGSLTAFWTLRQGISDDLGSVNVAKELESYAIDDSVAWRWDRLHRGYRCCGAYTTGNGYADWNKIRLGSVPDTCCLQEYPGCGSDVFATTNDKKVPIESLIYIRGCLTVIQEIIVTEISPLLYGLSVVTLISTLTQIFVALFTRCIVKVMNNTESLKMDRKVTDDVENEVKSQQYGSNTQPPLSPQIVINVERSSVKLCPCWKRKEKSSTSSEQIRIKDVIHTDLEALEREAMLMSVLDSVMTSRRLPPINSSAEELETELQRFITSSIRRSHRRHQIPMRLSDATANRFSYLEEGNVRSMSADSLNQNSLNPILSHRYRRRRQQRQRSWSSGSDLDLDIRHLQRPYESLPSTYHRDDPVYKVVVRESEIRQFRPIMKKFSEPASIGRYEEAIRIYNTAKDYYGSQKPRRSILKDANSSRKAFPRRSLPDYRSLSAKRISGAEFLTSREDHDHDDHDDNDDNDKKIYRNSLFDDFNDKKHPISLPEFEGKDVSLLKTNFEKGEDVKESEVPRRSKPFRNESFKVSILKSKFEGGKSEKENQFDQTEGENAESSSREVAKTEKLILKDEELGIEDIKLKDNGADKVITEKEKLESQNFLSNEKTQSILDNKNKVKFPTSTITNRKEEVISDTKGIEPKMLELKPQKIRESVESETKIESPQPSIKKSSSEDRSISAGGAIPKRRSVSPKVSETSLAHKDVKEEKVPDPIKSKNQKIRETTFQRPETRKVSVSKKLDEKDDNKTVSKYPKDTSNPVDGTLGQRRRSVSPKISDTLFHRHESMNLQDRSSKESSQSEIGKVLDILLKDPVKDKDDLVSETISKKESISSKGSNHHGKETKNLKDEKVSERKPSKLKESFESKKTSSPLSEKLSDMKTESGVQYTTTPVTGSLSSRKGTLPKVTDNLPSSDVSIESEAITADFEEIESHGDSKSRKVSKTIQMTETRTRNDSGRLVLKNVDGKPYKQEFASVFPIPRPRIYDDTYQMLKEKRVISEQEEKVFSEGPETFVDDSNRKPSKKSSVTFVRIFRDDDDNNKDEVIEKGTLMHHPKTPKRRLTVFSPERGAPSTSRRPSSRVMMAKKVTESSKGK